MANILCRLWLHFATMSEYVLITWLQALDFPLEPYCFLLPQSLNWTVGSGELGTRSGTRSITEVPHLQSLENNRQQYKHVITWGWARNVYMYMFLKTQEVVGNNSLKSHMPFYSLYLNPYCYFLLTLHLRCKETFVFKSVFIKNIMLITLEENVLIKNIWINFLNVM